jgi:predicted transcriptional regulator
MLKNITLSVDEAIIREARRRAAAQNTTLNALVREWLEQYVAREHAVAEYKALMARLSHVDAGRKFSREEMNERR